MHSVDPPRHEFAPKALLEISCSLRAQTGAQRVVCYQLRESSGASLGIRAAKEQAVALMFYNIVIADHCGGQHAGPGPPRFKQR